MRSTTAFVKWFDEGMGIGMVVGPGGEDILFHQPTGRLVASNAVTLKPGDTVECEIFETDKGLFASLVCVTASVSDDNYHNKNWC